MGVLETLSLAMGTAWTSGINLYATIAVLGVAGRAQMIDLPADLQILTHPLVITIACVMYVVEFFADKIPYVDSAWDAVHTFIRVPAGAVLASRAIGNQDPALELAAILAGGTVALAAHGTKAATRLAINVSPEPFSNWFASIGEDLAVLGAIWLSLHHPIIALSLIVGFVVLVAWLAPKLYRLLRQGFQKLRSWVRGRGGGKSPIDAPVP